MKKLLFILPLLALALTSCEDDDGPYMGSWFSGQTYTSSNDYDYSGVDYWILTFDGYTFALSPYNYDGSPSYNSSPVWGTYDYDWNQGVIYASYADGSPSQIWYFDRDTQQGWPYYNPNVVITIADGPGYLPGLSFYAGNIFYR